MKKLFAIIVIISFCFSNVNDEKQLSKELNGFKNFLGRTFEGEFHNSTQSNPLIDVMCFERILNGYGIRITHSVNNGEFGGEMIIMWNAEINKLESFYFTTGGMRSRSIVEVMNNQINFIEDVSKNNNGIKKVKKIYRIKDSGRLESQIKYYMNNIWVNSHELFYNEIPFSKVNFN